MQILAFVLYSRDERRRDLRLRPGRLNVITGSSGTGKSALSDILDYCFGARDFEVAVGPIRDAVSWYGLHLQLGSSQLFIARRNPYPGQTITGDAFVLEGDEVEVPNVAPAHPNTTINAIKRLLEQKLGISPNLHTPPEGQTREPLAATIRHALTFCLQKQTEIVSDRYLFHGTENNFAAQGIKDSLPYFLGAIREDRLALEQELRLAKNELRTARGRLREAESILGEGISKAQSLVDEAREVGLWESRETPTALHALREILEELLTWTVEDDAAPNPGRLRELQDQHEEFRRLLDERTLEIKAAKSFAQEAEGYGSAQVQQQLRLESIGLFSHEEHDSETCPLCSQLLEISTPTVVQLRSALERVRQNTERVQRSTPRIRDFINELEEQREELRRDLMRTQQAIEDLFSENQQASRIRDTNLRRSRVVGRASLWVESLQETVDTREFQTAVGRAQARLEEIEAQLDREEEEERLNSILSRINAHLSANAARLSLEHSAHPIRFDIRRLTVVADTPTGPVTLQTMGSGKNWLGYSLALHFALHRHLVEQRRPVPKFLFLDQPSQVYYPQEQDPDLQGRIDALGDEDREAVRSLFRFFLEQIEVLAPNFQVIVTEHADLAEPWYREAVVARWRGGDALIPDGWPAVSVPDEA